MLFTLSKSKIFVAIFAAVGFLTVCGAGWIAMGSWPALIACVRGDVLMATVKFNSSTEVAVTIHNLRDTSIHVLGVRTNCDCTFVEDQSRDIPSRSEFRWNIRISADDEAQRSVHFLTAHPAARDFEVVLTRPESKLSVERKRQ